MLVYETQLSRENRGIFRISRKRESAVPGWWNVGREFNIVSARDYLTLDG